ncbi:MAG TPA: hypothetical protein VFE67_02550 [Rudaea sp.]|jgi:hypothetical protein|nr:hypothetical protein [Rudaea sp.]
MIRIDMIHIDKILIESIHIDTIRGGACGPDLSSTIQQQGSTP